MTRLISLVLMMLFCNAAVLFCATGDCPESVSATAGSCYSRLEFSSPLSISISPTCSYGARSSVINEIMNSNTTAAKSYNELCQRSEQHPLRLFYYRQEVLRMQDKTNAEHCKHKKIIKIRLKCYQNVRKEEPDRANDYQPQYQ